MGYTNRRRINYPKVLSKNMREGGGKICCDELMMLPDFMLLNV